MLRVAKLHDNFTQSQQLDTVGVAGSIPVEPTIKILQQSEKQNDFSTDNKSCSVLTFPSQSHRNPPFPKKWGEPGANRQCSDGVTSLPCFCPIHPARFGGAK